MIHEERVVQDGYIHKRWTALSTKKSTAERYWETYAEWTLPSVYPKENTDESTQLQFDYSSAGAEAVNSMASSLGMTFFAPNRPFFKFEQTQELKEAAATEQISLVELTGILANVESDIMKVGEAKGVRAGLTKSGKNILITGNCLLYMPKGEKARMLTYGPRKFCVRRDSSGEPVETILREKTELLNLDAKVQDLIKSDREVKDDEEEEVILYTYMFRAGDKWITYQSAENITLTETRKVYNETTFPYHIQKWNLVDGEDYARGLVEDYAGDFHALMGTSASLSSIIAIIADTKFLVSARGGIDINTLNKAAAGTYVAGEADSIKATTATFNVPNQMIENAIDKYERRIGKAFLVNSSMIRDAERVTAEEINFIRDQLTSAYGPQYSEISSSTQLWLANMLMREIDTGEIKKYAKISITTGIDSLARTADNESIIRWLQSLAVIDSVPDVLKNNMKTDNISKSLATGFHVKDDDYYKTAQELAAESRARATEQVASNVDPNQQPQQQ